MSWLSDDLHKWFGSKTVTPPPPGPITLATPEGKIWGIATDRIDPTIKLIQIALIAQGAAIDADGEYGMFTETAVKRFQATHSLFTTGTVDHITAVALDQVTAKYPVIKPPPPVALGKKGPWVADVRACTGIEEVPGSANSPIIMGWSSDMIRAFPNVPLFPPYVRSYKEDKTPWCGWGMAGSMCRVGIMPPFGPNAVDKFMWADSWAHESNWKAKRLDKPVPGCIMVFTRAGGGHVSMLEKLVGSTAYIRGFNQSDMVNVTTHSMSQFTAAMWPSDYPIVDIEPNISSAKPAGSVV